MEDLRTVGVFVLQDSRNATSAENEDVSAKVCRGKHHAKPTSACASLEAPNIPQPYSLIATVYTIIIFVHPCLKLKLMNILQKLCCTPEQGHNQLIFSAVEYYNFLLYYFLESKMIFTCCCIPNNGRNGIFRRCRFGDAGLAKLFRRWTLDQRCCFQIFELNLSVNPARLL